MLLKNIEALPKRKTRTSRVRKTIDEFLASGNRMTECVNDGTYASNDSMYTSLWVCIKGDKLKEQGVRLHMINGGVFLENINIEK